jgi:hypothetical protein
MKPQHSLSPTRALPNTTDAIDDRIVHQKKLGPAPETFPVNVRAVQGDPALPLPKYQQHSSDGFADAVATSSRNTERASHYF